MKRAKEDWKRERWGCLFWGLLIASAIGGLFYHPVGFLFQAYVWIFGGILVVMLLIGTLLEFFTVESWKNAFILMVIFATLYGFVKIYEMVSQPGFRR